MNTRNITGENELHSLTSQTKQLKTRVTFSTSKPKRCATIAYEISRRFINT